MTKSGAIVIVLLHLQLAGCAHHRLVVNVPNPGSDYYKVTTHAFAWGAVERTEPAKMCATNSLDEVRVVTSLPQALATALTLGLWMPATIEYRCRKAQVPPGSTDF